MDLEIKQMIPLSNMRSASFVDDKTKETQGAYSKPNNLDVVVEVTEHTSGSDAAEKLSANALTVAQPSPRADFTAFPLKTKRSGLSSGSREALQHLVITVTDTGVGMSPDMLESIYEPYKTAGLAVTRPDGTGLGLPIAYQLVKRMKGRLCVGSREGVGTQVVVTLPLERLAVEEETMYLIGEGPNKISAPVSVNHTTDSLPSLRTEQKSDTPRAISTRSGDTNEQKEVLISVAPSPAISAQPSEKSVDTLQSGAPSSVTFSTSSSALPPMVFTAKTTGMPPRLDLKIQRPVTPFADIIMPPPRVADTADASSDANANAAPTAAPEQAKAEQSADAKSSLRVLIVEDSLVNQKLLVRVLASLSVDADVCNNGAEALQRMLGALADQDFVTPTGNALLEGNFNASYDLVLMDLNMPIKDGWETTRELRERGYEGAIVALTGNATEEARRRCIDCGFSAFVSKPCKKAELDQLLKAVSRQNAHKQDSAMDSEMSDHLPALEA